LAVRALGNGEEALIGAHSDAQRFWDRPRPAAADEGNADKRLDQELVASHDALAHGRRSALHFLRFSDDIEDIVHARRFEKIDSHRTHDEGETWRLLFSLREQSAVIRTNKTQVIGPSA